MKKCKVMALYRLMRRAYLKGIPFVPRVVHHTIRFLYSCELPCTCNLASNVFLAHNGLGVVIHEDTQVGSGSELYQNVTLGGRNGQGGPVIGDHVLIGTGACVLGEVTIGNRAKIGANAVVLSDVPEGAVVVGIPARVVKIDGHN